MEENEVNNEEASAQRTADGGDVEEINDDDINVDEIMKIDEILGGKVKMLDFEKQMFMDCIYNDALTICGK